MMVAVLFFVVISTLIIFGLSGPTAREFHSATDSLLSRQSYFVAESGTEDVYYRLKHAKTVASTETLVLGSASTVTSIGSTGEQTILTSVGNANERIRTVGMSFNTDSIVHIPYALETGIGGVDIKTNSHIVGDIYTNGPITGDVGTYITGSATSANSANTTASASNSDTSVTYDIPFGNTASTQSVAQSFSVSTSEPLSQVQLYLKKIGSPSNASISIVSDNHGAPGTLVYATGIFTPASVTSSYGWVNVTMSPNIVFLASTTYWVVVTTTIASSNYYLVAGSPDLYSSGSASSGSSALTWQAPTASASDLFFKIITGGFVGSIATNSGSAVSRFKIGTGTVGDARAHTVNYANVAGSIYCTTGLSNNKPCTTTSDPLSNPSAFDTSAITLWENDAAVGGTTVGTYMVNGAGSTLPSGRVVSGNMTVSGTLTLGGTLWVQGNLTINAGGRIRLASSYGVKSGVVIVNGTISVNGGGFVAGSGTAGSYLILVGLDNSATAFTVTSGTSTTAIVNIPNGTATVISTPLAHITAYRLVLTNSSVVTYSSNLTSLDVLTSSSAPAAYTISSWLEE